MAWVSVNLVCEGDLADDLLQDLTRIFKALSKRHGAAYRELERRIEAAIDANEGWGWVDLPGDDLRIVATPPPAFYALVAEAKAMGVI